MLSFFIVNNLVEGFELNKLKIKFNIVLIILKYDDVDEVSLEMVFVKFCCFMYFVMLLVRCRLFVM